MAETTYISTDVALTAIQKRVELITPVVDALAEGEPLRHFLRVCLVHYRTAIGHLERGESVQAMSGAISIAAMRCLRVSSEDFIALTDITALLSGQRLTEGANLDG